VAGVAASNDAPVVVEDPEIDAVAIATPVSTHHELFASTSGCFSPTSTIWEPAAHDLSIFMYLLQGSRGLFTRLERATRPAD
jgi:hypothetical protein